MKGASNKLLLDSDINNGHRRTASANGFNRRFKRYIDFKGLLVINLLVLMVNLYAFVLRYRDGVYPDESYFRPAMTSDSLPVLYRTLAQFTEFLDRRQFTYVIYSGTLLGAYRHGGLIPWDDDVDLLINEDHKEDLRQAVADELPEYGLYTSQFAAWKFYSNAQPPYLHKSFKYPYVDIFFYSQNKTHIWDNIHTEYIYPKNLVFPTRYVSFDHLKLAAPCASGKILKLNYRIDMCRSRQFNHMAEMPMLSSAIRDIPCEKLHFLFPFMHRHHFIDENGVNMVNQTLKISNWTLNSETILDEC